jgi:prevent-host-death family protein
MEVNIHEAKTQLSKLIERAVQGEEVVIAKAGKPLVKLVKIKPKARRILGSAAGTIEFVEGWDKPMTDEEFEEFVGK